MKKILKNKVPNVAMELIRMVRKATARSIFLCYELLHLFSNTLLHVTSLQGIGGEKGE